MSKSNIATPAEAKLYPRKRRTLMPKAYQKLYFAVRRMPLLANEVKEPLESMVIAKRGKQITKKKEIAKPVQGTSAKSKAKKKETGFFRKWFGTNISNYLRDEAIKKALQ